MYKELSQAMLAVMESVGNKGVSSSRSSVSVAVFILTHASDVASQ